MSPVEQGTVLVQLLVRLEGTCVFLLDFFLKKKKVCSESSWPPDEVEQEGKEKHDLVNSLL